MSWQSVAIVKHQDNDNESIDRIGE